jgi:hypothetical protein
MYRFIIVFPISSQVFDPGIYFICVLCVPIWLLFPVNIRFSGGIFLKPKWTFLSPFKVVFGYRILPKFFDLELILFFFHLVFIVYQIEGVDCPYIRAFQEGYLTCSWVLFIPDVANQSFSLDWGDLPSLVYAVEVKLVDNPIVSQFKS